MTPNLTHSPISSKSKTKNVLGANVLGANVLGANGLNYIFKQKNHLNQCDHHTTDVIYVYLRLSTGVDIN